jgi:hypothetical protein
MIVEERANSPISERKRAVKHQHKAEEKVMMIVTKEKPVDASLMVRIPKMVERNAKNKDQEEVKEQLEPSSRP